MILEIDVYRPSGEKTLLHFCNQWGNYKIMKSFERLNPVGGKYKHYEIDFSGISYYDISKIKKWLNEYELSNPGIWDVPEE